VLVHYCGLAAAVLSRTCRSRHAPAYRNACATAPDAGAVPACKCLSAWRFERRRGVRGEGEQAAQARTRTRQFRKRRG